jgi:hypothetical protein
LRRVRSGVVVGLEEALPEEGHQEARGEVGRVVVAALGHRRRRPAAGQLPWLLGPGAVELEVLAGEAGGQGLDEVGVDAATMRTSEHAAVVRVEVEPLVRVDQRLVATVALREKTGWAIAPRWGSARYQRTLQLLKLSLQPS